MTPHDVDQVGHIARLAVLAMCARGVAGPEFDSSPEVASVHISVFRNSGAELACELEFISQNGQPIGGMSL